MHWKMIIISVVTFFVSIWLNRLFMWFLLPVTFVTTKKLYFFILNRSEIFDSSWVLSFVIFIGKLQRTVKKFKSFYGRTLPSTEMCYENSRVFPTEDKKNTIEQQTKLILDYITRDFVESWVVTVTSDSSCVTNFKNILEVVKTGAFERLLKLDRNTCLQRFIELYQKHLKEFQAAKQLLQIQPKYRYKKKRETEFKVYKTVVDAMRSQISLHTALSVQDNEVNYVSCFLQALWAQLLDPKLTDCTPCLELVTNIIVSSALIPFINLLSQPYFLHIAIIKLTSDDEVTALFKLDKDKSEKENNVKEKNVASAIESHIPEENDSLNSLQGSEENYQIGPEQTDSVVSTAMKETSPIFSLDLSNPESNSEIEEAEDACLLTNRDFGYAPSELFISAEIVSTENVKEQAGNGTYTVYIIQYECWMEDVGEWEKHKRSVKRRYREFVTLQERFEHHPHLAKCLKGINGPGKWFTLPFGNTGDAVVEKRKQDLNRYLKSVVGNMELNNSMAFREFMAYNDDVSIAFVRKPSDFFIFDKVVVNTVRRVSSIFGKLTTKDKGLLQRPVHSMPDLQTAAPSAMMVDNDALQLLVQVEQTSEGDVFSKMRSVIAEFDDQMLTPTGDTEVEHDNSFHDVIEGDDDVILGQKEIERTVLDAQCPLMASVLDFALQTVENHETWVRQDHTVIFFKVLLGQFLQKFLENEVAEATAAERCCRYLELLTDTLWPGGRLDTDRLSPSDTQREEMREQARRSLHDFFPGFLAAVLGEETFNHSIDEVMQSLDHAEINKHFAYCLLDVMFEMLFPEIKSGAVQQKLLKKNPVDDVQNSVSDVEHV